MPKAPTRQIVDLPYIDIQHDALTVIDDVEQGVVPSKHIWLSAYKRGSSSVHGKVKVQPAEGGAGASDLTSQGGVQVTRVGKTTFKTTVPALHLTDIPVRFPRQVLQPAYEKKTDVSPALTVNSLAHSAKRQKLAIAGPDGYLALISTKQGAASEAPVLLKGHVGDVLDVKFFPSGEVILSTSSDLSIRIFGLDGSNPRTLKGHTRAVTCTAILGPGKEILSGSRDGTVRLWNVGQGKQVKKWFINPPRAVEALFVDTNTDADTDTTAGEGKGKGKERILAIRADGVMQVFNMDTDPAVQGEVTVELRKEAALVSAAWDQERRVLATGHSDGVITLRQLPRDLSTLTLAPATGTSEATSPAPVTFIRRNESSIYSLHFTPTGDLCIGTAAGLPCKLSILAPASPAETWRVETVEEYAGWDATGTEAWCDADEEGGVWCAGGEAVVRRY